MRTALLFLFASVVWTPAARADGPDLARVASARGLTVSETRGVPGVSARRGDRLRDGALLLLEAGGAAEIELGPHRMTLGPARTLVRVRGGSLSNYQVLVLEGVTTHWVDRLPEHAGYHVVTAVGSAGVRGTEFTVAAASDGSSYVGVEEGAVEFSPEVGSPGSEIPEGEAARRAPGEDIEALRAQDDAEVEDWRAEREEAFEEDPTAAAEAADAEAQDAAEKGREALARSVNLAGRVGRIALRGRIDAGDIEEVLATLVEGLDVARLAAEARARVEATSTVAARARARNPDLTSGASALATEASYEEAHQSKAADLARMSSGLQTLANLIRVARATSLIPRGGFSLPF